MIDPNFMDENPHSEDSDENNNEEEKTVPSNGEFEGFSFVAQSNHLNWENNIKKKNKKQIQIPFFKSNNLI